MTKLRFGLMLYFISTLSYAVLGQSLPAFPGAQGGGAASLGGSGRGGSGTAQVMYITSSGDSGPGTFRACIEASGPRTCIFRISAIIQSSGAQWRVTNPYLTIAGQTAPGGAIVIRGYLFIATHDVITRYITCDGNDPGVPTGPSTGTVCLEMASGDIYNIMWDHIATRWQGNKMWISYQNDPSGQQHVKNITAQWSMFYEPNILHPVGPGTDAIAFPAEAINQDFHHNMFVNIGHRIPLTATNNIHMVSNITYNWDYFAVGQPGTANDYIDNLWVAGNLNVGDTNPHPIQATLGNNNVGSGSNCLGNCDDPGIPSIYMSGNVCSFGTDYACTAEEAGTDPEGFPEVASPIRQSWRRSTPLPAEQFPIHADVTTVLRTMLTAPITGVGNSAHLDAHGVLQNNRDSQDQRIISQYLALGNGGEFNGPNYNGPSSTPPVAPGTPCTTSMNDGICDQWKTDQGLSLTDSTLYRKIASNGYTYLENFLNGTANNVTPPPPSGRPLPPTSPSATPH